MVNTTFNYVGRSSTGELMRGTIPAASRQDALAILDDKGVIVKNMVDPAERATLASYIDSIFTPRESAATIARARLGFLRLYRSYHKRGKDIRLVIASYISECPSKQFAAGLRDMLQQLSTSGVTTADVMAQHPTMFPKAMIEVFRATEKQGRQAALERLVRQQSQLRKRTSQQSIGLLGPILSYVSSGITFVVLSKFYVPSQEQIAKQLGFPLPGSLVVIKAIGDALTSIPGLFALAVVVLLMREGWRRALKYRPFALWLEKLVWRLFPILRDQALCDDRSLAAEQIVSLRKASVDRVETLETVAPTLGSLQGQDALLRQARRIDSGEVKFETSFATEPAFWGLEIVGLVSSSEPGTYLESLEELGTELEEEGATKAAAAGILRNFGFMFGSFLLTAMVIVALYVAQIQMGLATLRSHPG